VLGGLLVVPDVVIFSVFELVVDRDGTDIGVVVLAVDVESGD
jgi:hypothetical protein